MNQTFDCIARSKRFANFELDCFRFFCVHRMRKAHNANDFSERAKTRYKLAHLRRHFSLASLLRTKNCGKFTCSVRVPMHEAVCMRTACAARLCELAVTIFINECTKAYMSFSIA